MPLLIFIYNFTIKKKGEGSSAYLKKKIAELSLESFPKALKMFSGLKTDNNKKQAI